MIVSYIEAMVFVTGTTDFSHLDNEELDFVYHCAFSRLAYHMSREGYIRSLERERERLEQIRNFYTDAELNNP